MRERYDRLVAEVARYVDGPRDPLRELGVVAGLFRQAREVRRIEGIDARPVMRVVLERFERDRFGPEFFDPELYDPELYDPAAEAEARS